MNRPNHVRGRAVHAPGGARLLHKGKKAEHSGLYGFLMAQSAAAGVVLLAVAALLSFQFSFTADAKALLQKNLQGNSDLQAVNALLEEYVSQNKLLNSLFHEERGIAVFGNQKDVPKETDSSGEGEPPPLNLTRYQDPKESATLLMQLDEQAGTRGSNVPASPPAKEPEVPAMGGQEQTLRPERGDEPPANACLEHERLPVSIHAPLEGEVTSPFGYRKHPINGVRSFHYGMDICGETGTPIQAAAKGKVLETGVSSVYGNYLYLDHGGGLVTFYGHCSKILVKEGQTVKRGKTVAKVGNTGVSTGAHLHFGVRLHGVYLNPRHYI